MAERVAVALRELRQRTAYAHDRDLIVCHPETGHPLDRSKLARRFKQARYVDPRWGDHGAPGVLPKAILAWVRLTHHECTNTVCRIASFTYGTGEPTLWRHENPNPATYEWLRGEFAAVPLSFSPDRPLRARRTPRQELGPPRAPDLLGREPSATEARFAFFAGSLNACFNRGILPGADDREPPERRAHQCVH